MRCDGRLVLGLLGTVEFSSGWVGGWTRNKWGNTRNTEWVYTTKGVYCVHARPNAWVVRCLCHRGIWRLRSRLSPGSGFYFRRAFVCFPKCSTQTITRIHSFSISFCILFASLSVYVVGCPNEVHKRTGIVNCRYALPICLPWGLI